MVSELRSRMREDAGGVAPWFFDLFWRAVLRLGGFRSERSVNWSKVNRLVFVCSGNICRSAYAELAAKARGLPAASCGLHAGHGDEAHGPVIAAARDRGLDLQKHRTRSVQNFAWQDGDLALVVDPRCLRSMPNIPGVQTTLLCIWADRPRPHLQDPYGRSEVYLRRCLDRIDRAISAIQTKLPKLSSEAPCDPATPNHS